MAAGVGQLIEDTDFNSIRNKINGVMGTNSDGYGQSLSSSAASDGVLMTTTFWSNLRSDILKCRQHQTGSTESLTVPVNSTPSAGQSILITEALRLEYDTMADLCVTNNRVIGSGQYASEPGVSSTRAGNWSTSSSCQVRVAWADNATLRYFFNAGGRIYFTSDISSGTSKNNTWKGMISSDTVTYTSAMGTVTMDYTATACTGSGTTTSIGALDLTTSYQTIFTKYAPSGVYSENYFRIQAKFVDTNYNSIDFYILWQDDDAVIVGGGNAPAPGSSPGTPYGNTVDEAVTGTLDFAIGQYRPSGSNVSVTGGSYSTIAEISGS